MKTDYESLLYSYYNWSTVAKNKGSGYHFEINKNNQVLFYFGANHSRDKNDPQYEKIRNYWQKFLDKTGGKNSIVIVEGGVRQVHENEELAIKRDSDPGFITFLADKSGISTDSPEPDPSEQRRYLLKSFSEDEIDYYYFACLVNQWLRYQEPKPLFEKYMERYAQQKEEITNWAHHGFPLESMKRIHKKLFNSDFDENDKEFFGLIINPTKKDNPLQKVVVANSTHRNVHMVREIEKLWEKGKSIFIVYGSAHAILQEPALRKLLN